METEAILQPLFAMAILTCVMAVWTVCTRVPAMIKLGVHPQKAQDTDKLRDHLPHAVNRVANNYNHLFEQPVLFYAVCISIAILGHADSFLVTCAWIYVALRTAHSVVQACFDIVMIRFYLFIASWCVLATMIIKESLRLF